jgi:hypothetical protein
VNLTNLVVHAGIKKDALGRGGFSGVNVSRNADVAIALNGSMASHDRSWLGQYVQFAKQQGRMDLAAWAA